MVSMWTFIFLKVDLFSPNFAKSGPFSPKFAKGGPFYVELCQKVVIFKEIFNMDLFSKNPRRGQCPPAPPMKKSPVIQYLIAGDAAIYHLITI